MEAMTQVEPVPVIDARQLSTPERIKLLLSDLWIPYPAADAVLETLSECMEVPRGSEGQGMTLYGPKGAGKSWVAREFRDQHPRQPRTDHEAMRIPVLYFIVPAKATPDELYGAILKALGGPIGSKKDLHENVLKRLIAVETQVVIADEIQNLLSVSQKRIDAAINTLKVLPDELLERGATVSITLIGTSKALIVLESAEELHRRFPPSHFPLFDAPERDVALEQSSPGGGYRQFLAEVEGSIPLREASGLSSYTFAEFIFNHCGGYRHNIVHLLKASARYALRTNREQLSTELISEFIKKKSWSPPAVKNPEDAELTHKEYLSRAK